MTAGAGWPSAPVGGLVGGGLFTIPYPTSPTGPVPPDLAWVVITNSSPFTLLVARGSIIAELAAFTADLFEVGELGQGVPLTVLAQSPSISAGGTLGSQDTTVYAVWYEANPGGNYPAAIGAGAIAAFPNRMLEDSTASGGPGTNQFGPFSMDSAQAVAVSFRDLNAPATTSWQIQLVWNFGVSENVVLGPGGTCAFVRPTMGNQLTVFTSGVGGAGMLGLLSVAELTAPFDGFMSPIDATIFQGTANVAGGGGAATYATGNSPFGGRATFHGAMPSNVAGWQIILQTMDTSGAWTNLLRGRGASGVDAINLEVALPARPTRIQATNADAGARNMDFALTADWFG